MAAISLGVEAAAQAVLEVEGSAEGPFQRDLLVQHHADQQGQRVPAEKLVGRRILAQMQGWHGLTLSRQVCAISLTRGSGQAVGRAGGLARAKSSISWYSERIGRPVGRVAGPNAAQGLPGPATAGSRLRWLSVRAGSTGAGRLAARPESAKIAQELKLTEHSVRG